MANATNVKAAKEKAAEKEEVDLKKQIAELKQKRLEEVTEEVQAVLNKCGFHLRVVCNLTFSNLSNDIIPSVNVTLEANE